jgi:hypothetical protein
MTSGQRIGAGHVSHIQRLARAVSAAALTLLVLAAAAAAVQAQSAYSIAAERKGRPPAIADVNDCSRWATAASGFNPGVSKLPPGWGKPRPRSNTTEASYNRWMGACLGQREPPNR